MEVVGVIGAVVTISDIYARIERLVSLLQDKTGHLKEFRECAASTRLLSYVQCIMHDVSRYGALAPHMQARQPLMVMPLQLAMTMALEGSSASILPSTAQAGCVAVWSGCSRTLSLTTSIPLWEQEKR